MKKMRGKALIYLVVVHIFGSLLCLFNKIFFKKIRWSIEMRKFAILLLGIALLCSFSLIWNYSRIQKAKAAEATNASCGDTITSSLTLDGDLTDCSGDGLIVAASNIIIDGGNHSISGSGAGSGIRIEYVVDSSADPFNNITIRNFASISGFYAGIELLGTSNSTVNNVTANSNQFGIKTNRYATYDLDWNEVNGPESNGNTITNNITNNNTDSGIYLGQSTNTVVQNNQMANNLNNIRVDIYEPAGSSPNNAYYSQDIDDSNTIEGKVLFYKNNIVGTAETRIIYDAALLNLGAFWCISCAYLEVNNLTSANNNQDDVFLLDSSNIRFDRGVFINGINLVSSTNNTFQNSSITNENLTTYLGGENIFINNDFDNAKIILSSANNQLRNNRFANINGIPSFFNDAASYNQDIDTSNSVDGNVMHFYSSLIGTIDNPIILDGTGLDYKYLWLNNCQYVEARDFTITSSTADKSAIVLANSSNVTIKDSTISTYHEAAEGLRSGGGSFGIKFLNTDNSIIENNILRYNNSSISFQESSMSNIIRNNEILHNRQNGILFTDSDSNEISENTIEDTYGQGIEINGSENTTIYNNSIGYHFNSGVKINSATSGSITNNVFKGVRGVALTVENGAAINLSSSSGLTISGNTIMNNFKAVIDDGANTYSNNLYLNNINDRDLAFTSTDFDRTVATTEQVNYDFTICASCTATARTSPEETITANNSGTRIRGTFSPSKPGLYGLIVEVIKGTDTTRRKYNVYVDSIENTSKMYLRDVLPSHGQVQAWGQHDGRALLRTLTDSDEAIEVWYCGGWVQNSPDEIPNYPLSNLKKVIIDSNYKGARAGVMGIERYNTYDYLVDTTMPHFHVPAVVGAETGTYSHFLGETPTFNYPMDNPSDWYMLSIKYDTGSSPEVTLEDVLSHGPYWKTTKASPSFVNFVSDKTVNPAVKSISNPDVNIISATNSGDGSDVESATLVLDGIGSSNITIDDLERPFLGYTTTINKDNSTAVLQAVGITGETPVNTVGMNIIPSAGAIDVNVTDWTSSGDYYRKWTENSEDHGTTVLHNISGFKPSTNYSLKINGVWQKDISSDEIGNLSFNYDSGFSEKTFEIREDTTAPVVTVTGLTINRTGGYVDITGTASDEGSGVASITINGNSVNLSNLPAFSYRLLNLAIGTNSIEIVVTDEAGNESLPHLSFNVIYTPLVQPGSDNITAPVTTSTPIPVTYSTETEDDGTAGIIDVPRAVASDDEQIYSTPNNSPVTDENRNKNANLIVYVLIGILVIFFVIGFILLKRRRK
jgi:parallel beta-helix repeat protein